MAERMGRPLVRIDVPFGPGEVEPANDRGAARSAPISARQAADLANLAFSGRARGRTGFAADRAHLADAIQAVLTPAGLAAFRRCGLTDAQIALAIGELFARLVRPDAYLYNDPDQVIAAHFGITPRRLRDVHARFLRALGYGRIQTERGQRPESRDRLAIALDLIVRGYLSLSSKPLPVAAVRPDPHPSADHPARCQSN